MARGGLLTRLSSTAHSRHVCFSPVDKNFKLVAVPRESFGIFFQGDAYVIYQAEEVKRSNSSSPALAPVQHIHFWIGSEATQDEAGVAAYKTVELGRRRESRSVPVLSLPSPNQLRREVCRRRQTPDAHLPSCSDISLIGSIRFAEQTARVRQVTSSMSDRYHAR